MPDFTSITELPGSLLTGEQWARIDQRYRLAAGLAQEKVALEVGCGAGIGLGRVAGVAAQLVACDVTYGVLDVAQRHYAARQPLVTADAGRLPFATGHFDLVFSFETVYYLPQPAHFLRETRRVLKPGGQLLLGTSNPDWPHFVPGPQSVTYPNAAELMELLTQAGFAAVALWGGFPAPVAPSWKARSVAVLRQQVRGIAFLHGDNAIARSFKRLVYGRLHPLPAELPATAASAPNHEGSSIFAGQRDYRHRVLYALAR
jgi:SAM-dependent methyltransferase